MNACQSIRAASEQLSIHVDGVVCPLDELQAYIYDLAAEYLLTRDQDVSDGQEADSASTDYSRLLRLAHLNTDLPMNNPDAFNTLLGAFLASTGSRFSDYIGWSCEREEATYYRLTAATKIKIEQAAADAHVQYLEWDTFVMALGAGAPGCLGPPLQSTWMWVRMMMELEIVESMLVATGVSFGCAFCGILAFTRSATLALLTTLAVWGIVTCLLAFMCSWMSWGFGAVEAVSMIVFVGYSVDYVREERGLLLLLRPSSSSSSSLSSYHYYYYYYYYC